MGRESLLIKRAQLLGRIARVLGMPIGTPFM
jgi:hypothetical protein